MTDKLVFSPPPLLSSDLSPLLGPADTGPGVGFRQGVILEWDPITGKNVIDVAGGRLTDVSILNTGEAIALKVGHVVGLLTFGTTWFIVGRITVPGDSSFASASVAFASEQSLTTGFGLTAGAGMLQTGIVHVTPPRWADQMLVTATATVSLHNTRAAGDFAYLDVEIAGDIGQFTTQGFAANGNATLSDWQSMSTTHQVLKPNPNPGFGFVVRARMESNGANWVADAANACVLSVSAVFRSTI